MFKLSDIGVSGKVQNRFGAPRFEYTLQNRRVSDIPTFERAPFDRPLMAPYEIVKRDRIIAGGSQRFACVTADEPCAARDEDVFHRQSDSRLWRALHLPPAFKVNLKSDQIAGQAVARLVSDTGLERGAERQALPVYSVI